MGNTIGIVGGLIIGQAAVEANLVSPIVVIVISFTALCSFAIPNEEFATAFRILKFFFIAVCAWLGYFGMLLGLLAVLTHLSHLTSFGIPYLMPYIFSAPRSLAVLNTPARLELIAAVGPPDCPTITFPFM